MKISLEWISQFVDISDLAPEEIANRITMKVAEVEEVIPLQRSIRGVTVGEIVAAKDNPKNPKQKVVTVDCGKRRYETVCTAPNVKVGLKSAFASAGVTIDGGQVIKEATLDGFRSQGILCSAKELGLSSFHEVILEIPASIPNGTTLAELIGTSDYVVDIDNKSITHRPDLWGHYGMAREVAAVFNRPLKPLAVEDLAQHDNLPAYPLKVLDLKGCPCYCCMEIKSLSTAPSPVRMQARLHAVGQRTMNIIVDLTNYIMLELGQPMHAFDGRLFSEVVVKEMGREDTFITIDQLGRKMLPDDLMIYNQEGPVAIAGVMGGSNSEIREDTTHLLLESANFNAAKIRRTSVRLGLRTDASARFEKAQPPINSRLAIARFIHLLRDAGLRPDIKTRLTFKGDLKDRVRYVEISAEKFDRKVGMLIPADETKRILESMGFEADFRADALKIGIPPFRSEKDLSIPEDIVEEVARIYGYDDIEPRMPRVEMNPAIPNNRLRSEHKARRLLAAAHGFIEAHTYSWFDDQWLTAIGFEPAETLVLKNPSAAPQRQMRTTLIPNLLRLIKQNSAHSDYFKVFELGRVYQPTDSGTKCIETTNLAGFSFRQTKSFGLESHYRSIKGVLEDLAQMCADKEPCFEACEEQISPWRKPGEYVAIKSGGRVMGHLGLVTDPLLSILAQNTQVVWFELDFETFAGPIYPQVRHVAPPIYPGSWLDFSILWNSDAEFAQLKEKLDKFSHPLLRAQKFQYLYKGKGLPENKASYTFRCWIGLPDRTIATDQIDAFQREYFDFLKTQNLQLR